MLAAKAYKICVAYDGMEKYFPKDRILMTGNPVRQDLEKLTASKEEALKYFDINPNQKVILVLGGTTEGRKAVEVLEEAAQPYFYSTKGEVQQVASPHGTRITGALDAALCLLSAKSTAFVCW
jgi:UDP-N-acetylglucosamine:LPS N-acetylglucosamine transferase